MSQYISDEQFTELYEHLKVLLSRSRCSHTLRRTRHWLQVQGVDVRANIEKIIDIGGFCDCEVLMNVTPEEWTAQRDEALVTPDIVGEVASSAFVSRIMLQAVQHTFSFESK
jgi:hypothetical protein